MIKILEACRIAKNHGLPTDSWWIRKVIAPSMEQANTYGMQGHDARELFNSYMYQEAWERGADALAVARQQADDPR